MTLGLVVLANSELPMSVQEFTDETEYRDVLDGDAKVISLTFPEALMYVNGDATKRANQYNARASMICAVHNPAYLYNDPIVIGNVIIFGPPDEEGRSTDVPQELVEILLETPNYKILLQTADDKDAWNGNMRRFNEMLDAYDYAVTLAHKWYAVERVRVVPA